MKQAIIVVDLGFGDAGKGTIIDFLARHYQAHTVVRFNGGAQAAHNVVTTDGRHHTFSQFGSGSLVPGVATFLSRFMLVDPYAMFNEEEHLRTLGITDAFARTFIDRRALIITPFQQAANRLKELARGTARHGSCGMGVGEAVADYLEHGDRVPVVEDMPDRTTTFKKLRFVLDAKRAEVDIIRPEVQHLEAAQNDLNVFDDPDEIIDVAADNYAYLVTLVTLIDEAMLRDRLQQPGTTLFEGAQGVLLDEWYGFHPYTTWSTTTFANAETLLETYHYQVSRLGVMRTYGTRHGVGPFVSEAPALIAQLSEPHNITNPWQQDFRVGYFDLVASRYALAVAGKVDALALTHVDRVLPQWCVAYEYEGRVADLTSYFEHDDRLIRDILVRRPPDLAHQAQLTKRLWQCRPRYKTIEGDFVTAVEEALAVPVTIVSDGPTSADKCWRSLL